MLTSRLDRTTANKPTKAGYTWVEDRRVKAGGYWRKLPNGGRSLGQPRNSPEFSPNASKPSQTSRQSPPPRQRKEGNSFLKGAATLLGTLAVGGAVGAFAMNWASQKRTEAKINEAEQAANKKAQAEIARMQEEMQAKEAEMMSEKPERQVRREIERRTREIEDRVNREAQERIVAEREAAQQAAREEIIAATQPKARRSGDLISDEKDGIALSASVRQGLNLGATETSRANLDRRVNDAVRRIAAKQLEEGMQVLAVDFREKSKTVMASSKSNQTWIGMKKLMASQSTREGELSERIQSIQQRSQVEHRKALQDLHTAAELRGEYSSDLLEAFDQKSRRIQRSVRRDVAASVRYVREDLKTRWDSAINLRSQAYRSAYCSTQAVNH